MSFSPEIAIRKDKFHVYMLSNKNSMTTRVQYIWEQNKSIEAVLHVC